MQPIEYRRELSKKSYSAAGRATECSLGILTVISGSHDIIKKTPEKAVARPTNFPHTQPSGGESFACLMSLI